MEEKVYFLESFAIDKDGGKYFAMTHLVDCLLVLRMSGVKTLGMKEQNYIQFWTSLKDSEIQMAFFTSKSAIPK